MRVCVCRARLSMWLRCCQMRRRAAGEENSLHNLSSSIFLSYGRLRTRCCRAGRARGAMADGRSASPHRSPRASTADPRSGRSRVRSRFAPNQLSGNLETTRRAPSRYLLEHSVLGHESLSVYVYCDVKSKVVRNMRCDGHTYIQYVTYSSDRDTNKLLEESVGDVSLGGRLASSSLELVFRRPGNN